jgi:hypothetical protein
VRAAMRYQDRFSHYRLVDVPMHDRSSSIICCVG